MKTPVLRKTCEDMRALIGAYRRAEVFREAREGMLDPPDVVVVMGAQVLPGGAPSRTLEARVRHAARLYARGEAKLLIPTGGLGEHPPSEAEVMAEILHGEGVPDDAVVLEDRATSTWESACLVAALARERGIDAVRVVSDPLHCVRASGVFREAGLTVWPEPVYTSPMWRELWMRRGQLMREAGALVWYRLRYGWRRCSKEPGGNLR